MLKIEKNPGNPTTYSVTWGRKTASRPFLQVQQASVIQWALLNSLLTDQDLSLSSDKMQDDGYFYQAVLSLLQYSAKVETLLPQHRETLQSEIVYLQGMVEQYQSRNSKNEKDGHETVSDDEKSGDEETVSAQAEDDKPEEGERTAEDQKSEEGEKDPAS